ncbi:helix-turn-helix transcriptional regulator [Oceanithermus desulfurans]|uniref:HTH luxR-type domain-containing protein n=2 Tax=Oceanithermus desulfurans TaxID=227924 RepID=A0A511RG17_9DEIN|nr:hypothetical protein [Oceanithermus desulfurans]MBB6030906.1 DNA-binding CsgD family transcriptional regulator [Oceanithermus desulfurans]GEM88578.1 hypothetical protein ODE01S_00120 [Oceanithermus desulfurans NBRC 100063]
MNPSAGGASCLDPLIADALNRVLGELALGLIVDVPLGSLLNQDLAGWVAVTTSTSPLYLADLLEQDPRALVAGCRSADQLARIVRSLPEEPVGAAVYHGPPLGRLPLTRAERRLLKTYLQEDALEAAAERLGLKKKTAANRLAVVKEKLGVKTHGQLLRAYFGGPEGEPSST